MVESIYNFLPMPESERPKERMYRSKYDPKAPLTGSTFGLHGTTVTVGKGINELKKTCVVSSTFGPAKKAAPSPTDFLRKGSGKLLPVPRSQDAAGDGGGSGGLRSKKERITPKPAVPFRDDRPVMGLRTCRNFVTANAVEAILSAPRAVDDGGKNFMEKEGYGRVPDYLDRVKGEIRRENEMVDRYVRDQLRGGGDENGGCGPEMSESYDRMDEKERQELIECLKCKWDHVNGKYQKICHRVTIETTGDIKRKEAQEAELQQLEEDIEKLSRAGPLMIRKQ